MLKLLSPLPYLKLSNVLASVHCWGGVGVIVIFLKGYPLAGRTPNTYNLSSLEFVYMNTYSDISLPTDINF